MTWSKNVGRVAQEASRGLLCLPSSNTRGNRCLLRSHEDRQPVSESLRVSRRDRKVTRTSWSLLAGWPLSLGTVKIYCQRICQKLRVSHQRELTVRALANLHLARSPPQQLTTQGDTVWIGRQERRFKDLTWCGRTAGCTGWVFKRG